MHKSYTSEVLDADDGSGDLVITIPEEILQYQNWKEGQALMMEVKDGKIYLTALPKE
jgi:antitoxin component of MazEF toxin-antitoxin module